MGTIHYQKHAIPVGKSRLSRKYQIVVPKAIRQALNVEPKEEVIMIAYDGEVRLLKKPLDWISAMRGEGKELWKNLGGADAYLEKERDSWK